MPGADGSAAAWPERAPSAGPAGLTAHRSQAVLVLTEDEAGAEPLRAHLAGRGFLVEMLSIHPADPAGVRGQGGGAGPLTQVLAEPPGAIVLDLEPTSEYGWQLIDLLKQNPATQAVPVMFYSLLADDQGAVLALDYVTKPLGQASLAQALERLGLAEGTGAEHCRRPRGEPAARRAQDPHCRRRSRHPGTALRHRALADSRLPGRHRRQWPAGIGGPGARTATHAGTARPHDAGD